MLILLLAAIAAGTAYASLGDDRERAWAESAREAVARVTPVILRDIASAPPGRRWPMVDLAAQVPHAAHDALPALRGLLQKPPSPKLVAAVGLAVALVEGSVHAEQVRSAARLLGDEDDPLADEPDVRAAAAATAMWLVEESASEW